ncbi:hypothetical protein PBOI14_27780 [Pseudomonas sp. Boi14]|nr:hypothetical protein PBOI14_27780 [Pseudomonas sp. Boi14]
MFCFSQWRVRGAVSIAALLLGGCSFNGTYPDASAPDAAKLRFISSSDSSTLDLFDAEHCGGQTTGLLNNLFSANTRRRAAMSAAAPRMPRPIWKCGCNRVMSCSREPIP